MGMKQLQLAILVLLGILLLGTFIPSHAHMTKAYIGVENNQFIFGLESRLVSNTKENMLNIDLRQSLGSDAKIENGISYPAFPSKTSSRIGLATGQDLITYSLNLNFETLDFGLDQKVSQIKTMFGTQSSSGILGLYEAR
jgi:hypothetical protein